MIEIPVLYFLAASGGGNIFFDNSEQSTTDSGTTFGASLYDSAGGMTVGAQAHQGSVQFFYDGDIDVLAFWDRLITADEKSDVYAANAGIPCAGAAVGGAVEEVSNNQVI